MALLRATDAVRRYIAEHIEPRGITMQQYNVLRILRGARGEDIATLEVAARMMEKTPGITRLIDRLETKGWVERVRCPEDRRRVFCRITTSGLSFLRDLDPLVDRLDDEALRGLPKTKAPILVELLDGIHDGIEG